MKSVFSLMLVLALVAALSACSGYKGAIYSEYQQLDLDIRGGADTNAPIKINLGYDHATVAWIPKRTTNHRGEAMSIIASNDITTTVDHPYAIPNEIKGELQALANVDNKPRELLRVDSFFISGNAALVAGAPANSTVHMLAEDADTANLAGAPSSVSEIRSIQVTGSPGERIAAALDSATTPQITSPEVNELNEKVGNRLMELTRAADTGNQPALQKLKNAYTSLYPQVPANQIPVAADDIASAIQSKQTQAYTGNRADSLRAILTALQ